MDANVTTFTDADSWNRALYAFLAEKERRSGSRRTVEGYSRMLRHFFGTTGKPPDRITGQDVFAWAYGTGPSGKQPSSVTIGARLACLSSFYRFLIRMDAVAHNPCDALERPKVSVSPPRGLAADDIRRVLDVIPETRVGMRDRAIVLTLTLTGRRRAEVSSGAIASCRCRQTTKILRCAQDDGHVMDSEMQRSSGGVRNAKSRGRGPRDVNDARALRAGFRRSQGRDASSVCSTLCERPGPTGCPYRAGGQVARSVWPYRHILDRRC
jgi:hypothetical protein